MVNIQKLNLYQNGEREGGRRREKNLLKHGFQVTAS
jgi:hypothetical protein